MPAVLACGVRSDCLPVALKLCSFKSLSLGTGCPCFLEPSVCCFVRLAGLSFLAPQSRLLATATSWFAYKSNFGK